MIDKKIDLFDPDLPEFDSKLKNDLKNILESGEISTGKWTEKCEDRIKEIHPEVDHVLLVSSGTIAFDHLINLSCRSHSVENVYVQDFIWKSVKDRARNAYGNDKLKLIDCSPKSWLIENDEFQKNDLVVINQTFGNCHTIDHDLTICDSAHCIGAESVTGRGLGEFISFSPAKNITGCEAGAILTNNKNLYERCYKKRRYHGRVSELNARILYENLSRVSDKIRKNQFIYNVYCHNLIKDLFISQWRGNEIEHTHSEMAFLLHDDINSYKFREEMRYFMQIRKRYKPIDMSNENSKKIYDNIVIFPEVDGWEQIKIIEKSNQVALNLIGN